MTGQEIIQAIADIGAIQLPIAPKEATAARGLDFHVMPAIMNNACINAIRHNKYVLLAEMEKFARRLRNANIGAVERNAGRVARVIFAIKIFQQPAKMYALTRNANLPRREQRATHPVILQTAITIAYSNALAPNACL